MRGYAVNTLFYIFKATDNQEKKIIYISVVVFGNGAYDDRLMIKVVVEVKMFFLCKNYSSLICSVYAIYVYIVWDYNFSFTIKFKVLVVVVTYRQLSNL